VRINEIDKGSRRWYHSQVICIL